MQTNEISKFGLLGIVRTLGLYIYICIYICALSLKIKYWYN